MYALMYVCMYNGTPLAIEVTIGEGKFGLYRGVFLSQG